MASILSGTQLSARVFDCVICEKADDDISGTWRDNTYDFAHRREYAAANPAR